MKSTAELMEELRHAIADKCCEIEDIAKEYGLPLSRITVVARDPSNDKMFVTITNEPDMAALETAFKVGAGPAATEINPRQP